MDYHRLSFQELKLVAKDHRPRIKQYYIKSRLELLNLLTMKNLPDSYRIEKLTIQELRAEAKAKGVPGIWKMLRSDLLELLYPSSQKNNKNDDGGKEHDDPQESECDEVRV